MITGNSVPLAAAVAAWLAALSLGFLAGQAWARRKRAPVADPLSGLFSPATLRPAVDQANQRLRGEIAAQAVLRGRIDQTAMLRTSWDTETREQVLGQIAGVMKAGIRRDDSFARIKGDGFTIIMPGADERAALGVAERLRRALAQVRLPQFGLDNPFTASFGVASGRIDDSRDNLVARARAALDAAQRAGSNHVVSATEIEDVVFLPAPERPADAA
ncbi:GGDEF domain-containing protein [Erythrobacter dokdonensis]|uniref:GGDEF domain-containing protein n=1 Tax=Erythrobacter dokdonensis TaxID=328225 RepID=UPI0009FD3F8A|nr:GGDEF domain-containing protein [Erythrobacter dokdonensis]